jgi:hypothetical protein
MAALLLMPCGGVEWVWGVWAVANRHKVTATQLSTHKQTRCRTANSRRTICACRCLLYSALLLLLPLLLSLLQD